MVAKSVEKTPCPQKWRARTSIRATTRQLPDSRQTRGYLGPKDYRGQRRRYNALRRIHGEIAQTISRIDISWSSGGRRCAAQSRTKSRGPAAWGAACVRSGAGGRAGSLRSHLRRGGETGAVGEDCRRASRGSGQLAQDDGGG